MKNKIMDNSILISIIIPVYNVKEYLDECVLSVQRQIYSNIEIILVDDGSTDGSGEQCDYYAESDTRITVIHKNNGGLSDARNAGIAVATGEYILFLDSDDWIEENTISTLVSEICSNSPEIVAFGYTKEYVNRSISYHAKDILCSRDEALKLLIEGNVISWSACTKIFKRNIFSDLLFPVGKFYEDVRTTYKAFIISERISVIADCLYHYRMREGSISKGIFKDSRFDSLNAILEVSRNEYIRESNELLRLIETRELIMRCAILSEIIIYCNDDDYKKHKTFLNDCFKRIKDNRSTIISDSRFSKSIKFIAIAPMLNTMIIRTLLRSKKVSSRYKKSHMFYE